MSAAESTTAVPEGLVVNDVSLRFGGLQALDGVCMTVQEQSLHAVIGPNGAGKSSLFNVLCGFYRPSGSIRFRGQELVGRSGHRIAGLGIARTFQNLVLPEDLTVEECLLLGRHQVIGRTRRLGVTLGRRAEQTHRGYALDVAARVGVHEHLEKKVRSLSYGDQKRVELGRALCAEPDLLLLDEPVAGMNPRDSEAMGELISELCGTFHVSVVLVEHDMAVVMAIADQVTVLEFGRVIAQGPARSVVNDPAVLRSYLGSAGGPTTQPRRAEETSRP